jgi:hypothetical protein
LFDFGELLSVIGFNTEFLGVLHGVYQSFFGVLEFENVW